jgi:hypothetical protein
MGIKQLTGWESGLTRRIGLTWKFGVAIREYSGKGMENKIRGKQRQMNLPATPKIKLKDT